MKKQTEEEQRNKDTKEQSEAQKEGERRKRMRGGKEERQIEYNFNSVKMQTIPTYISLLCCRLL